MVIKYSAPELIAIGEMVTLKECISRASPSHRNSEPQYHQVYVPSVHQDQQPTYGTTKIPSNSISADNFLEDFAQFQHHLSQSIQFNRDIKMQSKDHPSQNQEQQQQQQLSDSVAEFFKKAQQNFHPTASSVGQADSTTAPTSIIASSKARRLSDVEAELLSQLKGHIHV